MPGPDSHIPAATSQPGAEVQAVAHQELIDQMPKFEAPSPTRSQRLALKAASLLMGQKTAEGTFDRVATDIGGYDVSETAGGKKQYKADVDRVIAMTLPDETAPSRPEQKYRKEADFSDATGVELSVAVARTASKARKSGPLAHTLRGRAARRLVSHATKGITARGHLRKN